MKLFRNLFASLTGPIALAALLLSLFGGAVFVSPAYAATITVNTTADENGTGAGCSLREAITAANTNTAFGGCAAGTAGADTITLPAGTYQLTLANAGANEDNNATGDLDVLSSLTIQGAGSGTTIIQAGTSTSNGIDKVFALNPICTSPINVTIDGVTVRFGRNSQPNGAPDFSFTGGGIDWCANGSGSAFTLSNSVVSDNTNVNAYGGGLNVDSSNATGFTVNLTNDIFQNNRTLTTVNTGTGGGVNLFGSGLTVNVTSSTFTGNATANATSGGGAIYFRPTTASSLSISGSTFSNNTAAGIGGAIATNTFGAGTTVSISNSSFTGNHATNSFGGALDLDSTNVNTTPFSLTHLIITGNTAGQAGGALFIGNSNVTMSKSLIVGNSAPTASGLRKSVDATTATVTNNWWGCSTGPGAAPCDTASTAGGTLSFTPWYRDQLTAATSPLVTNQSTSLTASFLTNSANTSVPLADLAELIGRSVTWAATHGNLSGTQGTVQAAGTATGSFQATSAGTAIISAKVDNDNTSPVSSNVLSLTVNKADTTTVISSDTPDPTVTGQSYTVNYTVTGSQGNSPTAPTGNVTVSDGTDSCTGTAAAGQCTLASFTAGSKSLTATYAGDANFNGSTSAGVAHTVNKADTTTTITSDNPDPSVVGQSVTVQYAVSINAPGSGTPTGNVTVSNGTQSCTGTVAAGQCSITFTSAGSTSLTATYAGDANYNGSTSASVAHTINKADTTTTITSDNPDPSSVSQSVTVNYSVAVNAPGAGTPTGNVTVSDGADSCTGTVAAGTCNITLNTAGSRTLTATYAGDSNFNGSTSAGEPHSVVNPVTTTTITSDNPDPSVVGQSVTVQYSVTSTGGTPTGNVTVSDGTVSCTGTVAAGQCSVTFTSAGAKSLTASYAGDGTFNGSTSAAEPHQVNQADTTTTITSDSPDPSNIGQAVTVNYSVSVNAPGSGTPTGNVTVSDGANSCTGTVLGGTCSITLTTAGSRPLTALYAGDSNFNSSTSAAEPHTVNGQATTTAITSDSPDPSVVNAAVTVKYSVTPAVSGTPTGNVTVSDGTISCTASVAAGQCSLTFTSSGARSLTASYAGDSNFAASTSAAEPHSVVDVPTVTSFKVLFGSQSYELIGSTRSYLPWQITGIRVGFSEPITVGNVNSLTGVTTTGFSGLGTSTLTWTINTISQGAITAVVKGTGVNALKDANGISLNNGVDYTKSFNVLYGDFNDDGVVDASDASGVDAARAAPYSIFADINGDGVVDLTDVALVEALLDTTPPDTTINSNPSNPSTSTSASFTFSGSDDKTPSASLTFQCQLDGGGFSSCTSPKSYSGLALGSHTFQVAAQDAAGNIDPTPASFTWTIQASTSLLYNAPQIVNIGNSFTPAAKLSSSASSCVATQTVSFSLDANPLNGSAGTYVLGSATTNSSGQATMSTAISTSGWHEGIYSLTASFAGTANCLPSSDTVTLTIATPGDSASGGGWYTLSGSGRINFGFTVRKTDSTCTANCTYRGQLLLINNGKWRLKGTIDTYVKTATHKGAASGLGDLYWWDATLNGGLGDWALAASGVSFTTNFYDSGKTGKLSTDSFTINIQYTPVAPQPSTLPNSTSLVVLKGGDIRVK